MPIKREIHQYDTVEMLAEIREDESVVNITGATNIKMHFKKPSGTVVTKNAAIKNPPGTNGLITYSTVASVDLDEIGRWQVQGELTISGALSHSAIETFKVYENIA